MGAGMNLQAQNEINELLFRLLDNEISDQEFAALKEWFRSDPQAREYYCRFMEDTSALTLGAATAIDDPEQRISQADILDANFWKQMYEEEQNAPALEIIAEEKPPRELIQKVERKQAVRTINKASLFAAIISAAALLFMIAMIHLAPPAPYEVATIYDSIDAKWSSPMPIEAGARIATRSKPIQLTQGVVKLLTDENVEVVLEGPTEFSFVSYSEIALNYGKLFARVSAQGRGFSVATPNSKVVDLGTEFGVLCHINGDTEVYMYKGKANLFAGEKSANKTSQFLTAGSARQVHHKDSDVREIALEETAVVRDIDSKSDLIWKGQPFSLADAVGGGNGFGGGKVNTGINVSTGEVISQLPDTDTHSGSEGFRAVAGNPYVDGVFVPGPEQAALQITSSGISAGPFPQASGSWWGYIFDGAFHEGTTTPHHALRLDGTVFGTRDNPAITIHSNQGITFDLAKIRKNLPGLDVHAFDSLIGVSETVQEALAREQGRSFDAFPEVKKVFDADHSKVEFWVFVDGRQVFHEERSSADGAGRVNIPLAAGDRFLTLAVTESDDTHAYDWALFARPELVLEAAQP